MSSQEIEVILTPDLCSATLIPEGNRTPHWNSLAVWDPTFVPTKKVSSYLSQYNDIL